MEGQGQITMGEREETEKEEREVERGGRGARTIL